MKTIQLVVLLIILLSACKKDNEFDKALIPGEYSGALYYFPSLSGGETGNNDPDLSKSTDYKTTITRNGSNFTVSFDTSFIYTIPDISFEITSIENSEIAIIRTQNGQAYSSSYELGYGQNHNYIQIDKYIHRVDFRMTLKSNNPDSIYYLDLGLLRIY